MSRRLKRPAPALADAQESEKLPLTKQQAASVLASQQAAQVARQQADLVIRGVMDAAGIDGADVTGGELATEKPFLTIQRKGGA